MTEEDVTLWIWLSLCCTPASLTFGKLIAAFDTPEEIHGATDEEIAACIGTRSRDYTLLCNRDLTEARRIYAFCRKFSVGLLPYGDPHYPASLAGSYAPPALLYYRGTLPDFDKKFFAAVVGSRHMSDYGRRAAFHISCDLARAGAVVVSGMALGIDGVALAGALSAEAPTVAVIGSGIDVCYPPEHRTLAREIVKRGVVMTEYPPGSPPNFYHFPARNRIIAALSAATLVIEGTEKSGSLITARHAKAEGRAVYALPGNVDSESSGVTTLLLKDGARVLTSADDVIRDFEYLYPGELNPFRLSEPFSVRSDEFLRRLGVGGGQKRPSFFRRKEKAVADGFGASFDGTPVQDTENTGDTERIARLASLGETAKTLYDRLPETGDCPIESLIGEDMPLRDVTKTLLRLEIAGLVDMLPGERVARKHS